MLATIDNSIQGNAVNCKVRSSCVSAHIALLLHRRHAGSCRDDARTVYVAMVAELGPHYLKFALGVLRSALPKRGYMGHVQGYTAHAVLQAVMKARIHTKVHLSVISLRTNAMSPPLKVSQPVLLIFMAVQILYLNSKGVMLAQHACSLLRKQNLYGCKARVL